MNVPQFAASIERDAEGRVVSVFCNGDLMGMLYELTEDEAKALCYLLNHYQERVHALVSEGERVGAAAERARIVEWLRATGGAFRFVTCNTACHGGDMSLKFIADALERGDHTRGEQGR